jgi:uncharacterized damage-inducible protein DinB
VANQNKELDLKKSLLEAYAVNERMNQYLLEHLDDRAWRAEPPGGKGRDIAAIAAHMHNVRHMWLTVSAKEVEGLRIPSKIDRNACTRKEVMDALAKSAECCLKLLRVAIEKPDGKVKSFRPDVVGFLGYLIAHDAHHRGQISMLARQSGYPLPKQADFGLWEWGKLWRECGFGD